MALPPNFLDELRARTPLGGLIGRKVKLARSGRNLKGNCPFHGEKTPSFYVYDDHFHCFGCGVGGDVFKFAMLHEKVSFPESIELVARRFGIPVPENRYEQGPDRKERDEDGDGFCEVHVNTMEGFWSLLRSWLRPHRGIPQETLPLYLGFFEFVHNVRARGKRLLGALIGQLLAPPRNPS